MRLILTLLMVFSTAIPTLDREFSRALREACVPLVRPIREFMEQDVIIPTGRFQGEPFRVDRQPFTGLLFDEMASKRWPRIVITGPSQSGKTLAGHVGPSLYAAVELRKNLGIAMPDMRMVNDKWTTDFLPVFQASPKLRALLPRTGPGSGGGQVKNTVTLTNGTVIKFFTKGGDDTARAGYTATGGIYVTEAAGFSHAGDASVEAHPLKQLEARMRSLPRRDRYLVVEGTSTTEAELPWSEHSHTSQSRIVVPCPACLAWITPERPDLIVDETAKSEIEAGETAFFACPSCGQEITDAERRDACRAGQLLHAGQTIEADGTIVGDVPETETLWFRWNSFNNLLLSAYDLAIDEWKASRLDPDSKKGEDAEKEQCQFVWAVPYKPRTLVVEPLGEGDVSRLASELPRGVLPEDTRQVALFCDVGMYELHWVLLAGRACGAIHCPDYGTIGVLKRNQKDTKEERAAAVKIRLLAAFDALKRRCQIGWQLGGLVRRPDRVLIDVGWETDTIHGWLRKAGSPFFGSDGRGTGQRGGSAYTAPRKKTSEIREICDGYDVRRHARHRTLYFTTDVDRMKSEVHRSLRITYDDPGSMSLFLDQQLGHKTFERHMLAERETEKPHAKHGGMVRVWENPEHKPNHYFDCVVGARYALDHAGFRIDVGSAASPKEEKKSWFGARQPAKASGRAKR